MSDQARGWKLPWQGGCRCGALRVAVSAPPLLTMACHCRGCQKMSASAYSLSIAVPAEGFAVTSGEPVLGGLGGPEVLHHFCPRCMSWVFTRMAGLDSFVNLRATMLDEAGWFSPFIETCTAEMLPWAKTPAIHRFEGFPPFEAYEGLIAEFAGSGFAVPAVD